MQKQLMLNHLVTLQSTMIITAQRLKTFDLSHGEISYQIGRNEKVMQELVKEIMEEKNAI